MHTQNAVGRFNRRSRRLCYGDLSVIGEYWCSLRLQTLRERPVACCSSPFHQPLPSLNMFLYDSYHDRRKVSWGVCASLLSQPVLPRFLCLTAQWTALTPTLPPPLPLQRPSPASLPTPIPIPEFTVSRSIKYIYIKKQKTKTPNQFISNRWRPGANFLTRLSVAHNTIKWISRKCLLNGFSCSGS